MQTFELPSLKASMHAIGAVAITAAIVLASSNLGKHATPSHEGADASGHTVGHSTERETVREIISFGALMRSPSTSGS